MVLHDKNKINTWWVAKDNAKMAFVNILDRDFVEENDNFLVVRYYMDKEKQEIGISNDYVKEVRLNGVVTAKGTFYPFSDAHPLYLEFLIEANRYKTVIATNWEITNIQHPGDDTKKIVGDVLIKGKTFHGIHFDFLPIEHKDILLTGYSKRLNCKVVLTTFARRNVCDKIKVPECIMEDMYKSSFVEKEEVDRRLNVIQAYMSAFM